MKDLSFLSLQVKQLEKIISKFEIMEKFMDILQKTENVEIAKDEADIDENEQFSILGYVDSYS